MKGKKKGGCVGGLVSIVLIVIGIVQFCSPAPKEDTDKTETNKQNGEVVEEAVEETNNEDIDDQISIEEINEFIADYLADNQGWAMGTVDENGDPIEDGEPNSEYANWMFIKSITYTEDKIDVDVTADFEYIPVEEKNSLANSCQGIAMYYGSLASHPYIQFHKGDTPLGNSETLDPTKYSWE